MVEKGSPKRKVIGQLTPPKWPYPGRHIIFPLQYVSSQTGDSGLLA